MSGDFLNDRSLRGPLGTRRQPQVGDLIPHVRLQEKPLWNVPEDGTRWFTSPYLWQQHQGGIENVQIQQNMLDQAVYDDMLRAGARQFDVQERLLRQMLEEHQRLAQQLLANQLGGGGGGGWWPFGGGGKGGGKGGGAQLNEAAILNAIRPLIANQATALQEAIQNIRVHVPPPVVDGQQLARSLAPLFGQQAAAITQAIAAAPRSAVSANPPSTADLPDVAASSSGRPPPPPPPPALPAPVQAAMLALPTYMRDANAALAQIAQQNNQVIQQLATQAAAQQVGTAIATVEDHERLNALGDQMRASITSSFDRLLAQLPAIALAHQVAPNPQLTDLERRFTALQRTLEQQTTELARAQSVAHQNPQLTDQSRAIAVLQQDVENTNEQLRVVADRMGLLVERLALGNRDIMRAIHDQAVTNAAQQQLALAVAATQSTTQQQAQLALQDAQLPTLVPVPGTPSPRRRMLSPPRITPLALGPSPNDDPAAAMAIGASSSSSSGVNAPGVEEAKLLLQRGPMAELLAKVLGAEDTNNVKKVKELMERYPQEVFQAFRDALVSASSTGYSDEALLDPGFLEAIATNTGDTISVMAIGNPADRKQTISLLATLIRAMELRRQSEQQGNPLMRGLRRVTNFLGLGDTPSPSGSPARRL